MLKSSSLNTFCCNRLYYLFLDATTSSSFSGLFIFYICLKSIFLYCLKTINFGQGTKEIFFIKSVVNRAKVIFSIFIIKKFLNIMLQREISEIRPFSSLFALNLLFFVLVSRGSKYKFSRLWIKLIQTSTELKTNPAFFSFLMHFKSSKAI